MSGSTFGTIFKLSTFGESHGKAMGGVIEGFPAGISVDVQLVQQELDKRRPGQSEVVSARNEKDEVEFLSGIFEGKSTGTPIGFTIYNNDQKSKIIRISRILIDLPMLISPMKKNTAFVIIEEEEDPVQEKQFVE